MSQASFVCVGCGETFLKTGRNQKRCDPCRIRHRADQAWEARVKNGLIKKPGVGSGGNQGRGEEHHSFSTGRGFFVNLRNQIRQERRYCERCCADLADAGRYHWTVHHRDHNPNNNPLDGSNWELLCKACHQGHHEQRDELGRYTKDEGATTIPKGSTP